CFNQENHHLSLNSYFFAKIGKILAGHLNAFQSKILNGDYFYKVFQNIWTFGSLDITKSKGVPDDLFRLINIMIINNCTKFG
ncbi:hypothetical protein BpHYR1_002387, partial [Brachionus plicatilis]